MDQSLSFNRALVEKYDRPGPRYTSYPTAADFVAVAPEDHLRWLRRLDRELLRDALRVVKAFQQHVRGVFHLND